ncbi:reverse transcriptase domain-containing protein, partial [Tanacetum coccineum]
PVYQVPSYQAPTTQIQGVSKIDFENYIKANDAVLKNVQNQGQILQNQMANVTSLLTNLCNNFKDSASTSRSGTLPSQTVTNPREHVNAITTRSGKTLEGPSTPLVPTPVISIPQKEPEQNPETSTEKVQNPNLENTAHVPPPGEEDSIFIEIPKPKAKKTVNLDPNPNSYQSRIPYPERMKVRENDKPSAQHSRFLKMFKQLRLEIGLKDALVEMPKFNKWLSSLLRNKEKLEEIAITTVNAECSAIIMNKVPEKLEDPGKFLIPCALQELNRTSALADSGASINLLPHSIYKKLELEALTPTRMTLELANRSITHPMGIAEDVVVRVDGFTFLADFVVVNFEPDPRVPIILGRPFLRTAKALIDNSFIDMQQIAASLEDKMTIKMKQMMNEMKALVVTTPATVKAVEEVSSTSNSGTLPSQTVTNPRQQINAITTRSGLLRQCPHHGFSELHQLDTFYNSLNSNDQDALDSAAGGNFLDKMPQEGLAIIESKSKVRYSRSRANDSRVSTDAPLSNSSSSNNSFDMQQIAASLEDKMTIKMNQMMNQMKALVVTTPAPVKAVEEALTPQIQGVSKTDFENYVKANDAVLKNVQNQGQNLQNQMANVTSLLTSLCDNFKNPTSLSNPGTLPSQTVTNPRQQINAITTRSGKTLEEPLTPLVPTPDVSISQNEPKQILETSTEKVQNPNLENTAHVPSPGEEDSIFMEIPKPKAKKTVNLDPNPNSYPSKLPYPERMKVREHDKPSAQHSRFLKMFKQLRLEIGLKDALVEMPKFNKWLSSLLRNKEKLEEIAITTVNAECSAIIMNKVPEKLEDPGKFLIPCALQELKRTSALADSGASINLLPHSIYKKLELEALTPTRMTLELANRSISHPMGIAEDVVVRVDGFTFLADFVVVNFEPDPRVPIILGRPFLRTAKALIDLYEEKLTLRVGKDELVYYADKSEKNKEKNFVHAISVIDFSKDDPFSGSTTTHSDDPSPSSSPVKTSDNFVKFADELAPLFANELAPLDSLPPENDKDVEIKSSSSFTLTLPEESELEVILKKNLLQIDDDAMEEIDIRWQVAIITARIRKFMRKTGRPINLKPKNGITFDKSKIECFNCQKLGHFARECKFAKYQANRTNGSKEKRIVPIEDSNSKALVAKDNQGEIDWTKEFDDDPVTFAMMALNGSEEDDWSIKIDVDHVDLGQDGLGVFD